MQELKERYGRGEVGDKFFAEKPGSLSTLNIEDFGTKSYLAELEKEISIRDELAQLHEELSKNLKERITIKKDNDILIKELKRMDENKPGHLLVIKWLKEQKKYISNNLDLDNEDAYPSLGGKEG